MLVLNHIANTWDILSKIWLKSKKQISLKWAINWLVFLKHQMTAAQTDKTMPPIIIIFWCRSNLPLRPKFSGIRLADLKSLSFPPSKTDMCKILARLDHSIRFSSTKTVNQIDQAEWSDSRGKDKKKTIVECGIFYAVVLPMMTNELLMIMKG